MRQELGVLLLNTQMEAAGAQKAMLELARGLKRRGHKVSVVTMYDKGNYVAVFAERYDLGIIDVGMKRPGERNPLLKGWRFIGGIVRLYRLMRTLRPQVLQTFSHYSNILGPLMAWLAGVPVRISSQRMSLKDYSAWLLWLDRTIANSFLVHRMVAVSEGTRRFCIEEEGINPDKLVKIHNGIDTKRFSMKLSSEAQRDLRQELGLYPKSLVVLTVARLHPQKGHRYLIEAIPQILRDFPQARFLFVGEGALAEVLVSQVSQTNLDKYIRFLGVRQDIPQLLAISDLFVLPSLWEGLPNSVLEAMAAGVPVIATDVDGTPELIGDGRTGLLVPPADPDALEEAICRLLRDESLRTALAEAARQRVEREFSCDVNLCSFVDLYQSLVAERMPRE
jgi:glycosyltransferase involved in cell wall biosynthesis